MGLIWSAPSTKSELCFLIALMKWKAPIKLAWSVRLNACILSSAAALTKSSILLVDCKMEYWEWVWRWTKGVFWRISSSAWEYFFEDPSSVLANLTNRLEAAFKLRCFKPMPLTGWSKTSVRYCKISPLFFKTSGWIAPCRKSSKKQRAVASTSAVALWASSKWSLKRWTWSSPRVGNLNFPPLPPANLQSDAVCSVQVSITGKLSSGLWSPNLKNSAPMMLRSNFTLCPPTKSHWFSINRNFSNTSAKGIPSFWASVVEIPWIFSES